MDGDAFEPYVPARFVRSSELLGFSPEARVLIVNSDDFGMYEAVNAGVIQSIEEGIASSCSLMVPCPWAWQAIDLLRKRPEIPFGVHLTLFCDTARDRWGPLTAKERVPTLLDGSGELFPPARAPELLARARLEEVELEFRAQVDAVLDAGLVPTHLDWHCLADGGREDIFDLTVGLAHENDLAVRVWLEAARQKMRRRGLPVLDHEFLDSFSLDIDGKSAHCLALLRDLPVGLSEWAVHPAVSDEDSRGIDPDGWRVRRSDHEFLTSPHARELIEQEGIFVSDYRSLRLAWHQTPP